MARWLWTQKQDVGPGKRAACGMVYDAGRRRTVLLGDETVLTASDTWEWDGEYWIQVSDMGPKGGRQISMAYDDHRGLVVVLDLQQNTWEWDGEEWTQVADSGPLSAGAMTYDAHRKRSVLFTLGQTWEWNGKEWTQIEDTGPGTRLDHALAYDAQRGLVVLFGGVFANVGNTVVGDTWEWDGDKWEQKAAFGPPGRFNHAMAYDSANSRTLLFGGMMGGGADVLGIPVPPIFLKDTWEWNGRKWLQLQDIGPSPRRNPVMAFDGGRKRMVLFGGTDGKDSSGDTWELVDRPVTNNGGAAQRRKTPPK